MAFKTTNVESISITAQNQCGHPILMTWMKTFDLWIEHSSYWRNLKAIKRPATAGSKFDWYETKIRLKSPLKIIKTMKRAV